MKTRFEEPALFISRDGASKAGLKLIAKLPNHITGFEVIGPLLDKNDTGYHLLLITNDIETEMLSYEALELLI